MIEPIQTNLDEIYLEEIETAMDCDHSSKANRSSKIIYFSDGKSIEVDSNGNLIDNVKVDGKKNNLRPKKLKLFQLISSPPIEHLVNVSSNYSKKSLRKIDSLGESIASLWGITKPKYESEIISTVQRIDRS